MELLQTCDTSIRKQVLHVISLHFHSMTVTVLHTYLRICSAAERGKNLET